MERDSDRLAWVRDLAPEVDRLFRAGYRAARPLAVQVATELRFNGFGALVDLRRLLLDPEGMRLRDALALQRYADPIELERLLDRHVREGHLASEGEVFRPTSGGRAVLQRLTEALAGGLDALWAGSPETVGSARALTTGIVEHAASVLSEDRFPAFHANARDCAGAGVHGPPLALWSNLAALRYLRADAHALAWSEAGLSRLEILCLTELCHRKEATSVSTLQTAIRGDLEKVSTAIASLARRGWISGAGLEWNATDEGRRMREDVIERRTDSYTAAAFETLSREERRRLLEALRHIPDESVSG